MEEIMRDVCADFETGLAESNGEANHVHLLVNFPPKGGAAEAGQQPQHCPACRVWRASPPRGRAQHIRQ
jgi:REP element-mobilizing transposase RayT